MSQRHTEETSGRAEKQKCVKQPNKTKGEGTGTCTKGKQRKQGKQRKKTRNNPPTHQ